MALWFAVPGLTAGGRTEDRFITLADYAPTILELAEVETPLSLTGASLTPLLVGGSWEREDVFHSQLNGVELYYTQRIIATRTHKYVYNGFDLDELYDLTVDSHERTNLASNPAYNDIKHDLVRRMWRFAADQDDEHTLNNYGTVALAPWGPADALDESDRV